MTISDIAFVWTVLVALTHFSAATAVTFHAILRKRESQTVAAWVALAWMAPVIGSFTYLCLGINRISRTGASLALKGAWEKARPDPNLGAAEHLIGLAKKNPSFVGLARAGGVITGRKLTLQNEITPLIDGDEAYPNMVNAIEQARHSVTLLSYMDDLNIGVNTDPAAVPDPDVLIECMQEGFDEILKCG